jgi:hypothetical protein
MLDIDRQLPRVRAMGKPKRALAAAIRRVAGGGDGGSASGAGAGDGGYGGDGAALDGAQDAVDAGFVGDGVLGAGEGFEVVDVGAGGEGFFTGAGDDEGADGAGGGGDLGQAFVHREGQGVAGLRAVEGDGADAVVLGVEQVLGHGVGHLL